MVFSAQENFRYYSYKAAKSYFVSIWYPAEKENAQTMKYGEYFDFPVMNHYPPVLRIAVTRFR